MWEETKWFVIMGSYKTATLNLWKSHFSSKKPLLEGKSEISWTKYASTHKTPLKREKKLWEKCAGRSQRGLMAFEVQQRCQLWGWHSPWLQEASLSCKANVVIIMWTQEYFLFYFCFSPWMLLPSSSSSSLSCNPPLPLQCSLSSLSSCNNPLNYHQ